MMRNNPKTNHNISLSRQHPSYYSEYPLSIYSQYTRWHKSSCSLYVFSSNDIIYIVLPSFLVVFPSLWNDAFPVSDVSQRLLTPASVFLPLLFRLFPLHTEPESLWRTKYIIKQPWRPIIKKKEDVQNFPFTFFSWQDNGRFYTLSYKVSDWDKACVMGSIGNYRPKKQNTTHSIHCL